jgi:hypothetical protein
VRPLHGGAAFYGFPAFGGKPGVCAPGCLGHTAHLFRAVQPAAAAVRVST